ncbi:platelet endothelial aggregation receptor 1 [Apteryx rowi]|uniref:platelet endothelial aggregation receptor 1 n=1 Tax=Apteryx rowi TaxID=308060 RepID=UPI000E1D3C5A|nr:platelet endothelial aggregation receptor 1 [Apteryx rowi]
MALRAAALALHACLLAALHPSDPNVCSYWESFTAAVKESYAKPHVVLSAEPCAGALGFPQPCPQQKIAYRTAYRQAVRTDYRRRYHCCLGYYESRDACVPRCTHECVHGRCVAPDRCQCEPGWRGADCSSQCEERRWGRGCERPCACHHGAPCDPLSGACCNRSCECAHGAACSPRSGACSCAAGWRGPRCRQPCLNGTFGSGCSQQCSCTHAAGCDPVTGTCRCLPGWTGPRCERSCEPGFWGQGCSQPCACRNGAACSPQDGSCTCAPGYRGPACQRPCQPGRYGKKCALACSCGNRSSCHPADGSCLCAPGWTGGDCSRPCAPGTFGLQCAQLCECPPNATCHPESGTCQCAPGRIGPRCEPASPEQPYTIVPAPAATSSSLGLVLSLVALAALLVAAVAAAACYRLRQRGKESRHLAVAYVAGRPDASEYAVPDVPPAPAHYYSNPSYHTLSQCTLPVPDGAASRQVPGGQLFAGVERPYGSEGNATLPPDWKHYGAPARGRRGGGHLDRSYSYSYTCSLGKYYGKDYGAEGLGASASSLGSENPYATIKDLPVLTAKSPEGSYMEMKSPVRREMSYAEIGLLEQAPGSAEEEICPAGAEGASPEAAPNHYDSPKNSHIPSHYDMPPVRHYPPSPPLRRKDR